MNIFVLHENPTVSARMLCDRHVVKMTSEQGQMLCYAHLTANPDQKWVSEHILFSLNKGHSRHPCTLWLLEDPRHYAWGYRYLLEMLREYDHRYGGENKYAKIRSMLPALNHIPGTNLLATDVTELPDEFVLAMGKAPECIGEYAVEAYRRFYIVDKYSFASWKKRPVPAWFTRGLKAFKATRDISRVEVVV